MPDEIAAYGGHLAYPGDDRTTPDTLLAIAKFPQFVLQWEANRLPLDGEHDNGTQFIAADGSSVTVWRGGWSIKDPHGKDLPKPPTTDPLDGLGDHVRNFLDCVESRKPPRSNLESMYQTTTVCHLMNMAYLGGQTVRWDKSADDLVGTAGRETLPYRREYRKPWNLPMA